ncbi:hypothetical protein [Microcoleus sp. Pol10D4]|uniref:hypothetical protein n=2 Tax=unclassified Microcoleus TaxID=2642155 RepID=UPI002FD17B16
MYNPPSLARKEAFVTASYPHYDKFAKLTRQEEKLDIIDRGAVKKYREWMKCLEENCIKIKDHKLFWRSNADPERLKMLEKAVSERQQKKTELNPGNIAQTAEDAEEGKEDGKKVQIEAVERG